MRKKNSSYYKRYNEFQKFKVAELEFNRETDLETYIYNARIVKLIFKALLKKRQRYKHNFMDGLDSVEI